MAKAPITVRLDGLPEALKALEQFSKGIRRKQTRIAISAGGGVLKEEAIRRVTKDTGLLKKNLVVKVTQTKDDAVFARIGARRGVKKLVRVKPDGQVSTRGAKNAAAKGQYAFFRSPSRYAHLLEKGTQAHTVAAKKKRVLARAGRVFGTSVVIRARAKPFLEPAARTKGRAAVERSKQKLAQGIEHERLKAWGISKKPK